jgi:CheY-like chemotaxis protein
MNDLPPILVVDDAPEDSFILSRLLLKAGVRNRVIIFEEPRPACSYLEAEGSKPSSLFFPVFIFTDFHMPVMNGSAFTKWIRNRFPDRNIPICMITGSVNPEEHQHALESGATELHAKFPSTSALATFARKHGATVT